MAYKLTFDKAYYGAGAGYDLFTTATFPELAVVEDFPDRKKMIRVIRMLTSNTLSTLSTEEIDDRLKMSKRNELRTDHLFFPEALVAHGSGFHFAWEKIA